MTWHPEILTRPEDKWRTRLLVAVLVLLALLFASIPLARVAHAGQRSHGTVYLPHPQGCPHVAFCGCGAAWDLGIRDRALWLSSNWFRFPRTQPARNTVAVRRGHVFVLKQHVRGQYWMSADYNSGKHQSRLHVRSIAGFTIVDPRSRVAMVR